MGIEIRVFDMPSPENPEFVRRAITHGAVDISIIDRFYEPGMFTVKLPTAQRTAKHIRRNSLLLIDNCFWGIVRDIKFEAASDGDVLTATGRQLKGLARQRITIPPDTPDSELSGTQGYDVVNGTTEKCMKHFARANMIGTGRRGFFALDVAPDLGRGVPDDKYMTRHDRLHDVLKELGEAAGLGYDIKPDLAAHRLVFDVVEGVDRSAPEPGQPRIRPSVIFEIARKNLSRISYEYKTEDAANAFYTTKSGAAYADEALTMVYYREDETEPPAGLLRDETHMSISADTPVPGGEYEELRRKALIQAEGYRPAESFTCGVTDSRYAYGKDYFLGDIVTIRNKDWGVTVNARLSEMRTQYTSSGISREATFGNPAVNVFGRIKRQIRGG